MTFNYQELADEISIILVEFGQIIQISRTTGETTDPVEGTVTPGTTVVIDANGFLKPYPDKLIDGTRILESDRMLILDNTIEPLISDLPLVQGENWTVKSIKTVKPTNAALVYFLQVAR